MKYLDKVKFDYYEADIKKCNPIGRLTLRQFIEANKNPNDKIKNLFTKIADAAKRGNLKLKAELKKQLYFFTPCVLMLGWRSYKNIEKFTGLMQIDFDSIINAEAFRDELFKKCSFVICAYVSPSKLGVKALIRIPIVKTVDEFKSYFYGLSYYLERYPGYDPAPKSPVLSFYLSYDPDLKFRENPTIWDIKGGQYDEFPLATESDFEPSENLTPEIYKNIIKHIKNCIRKADKESIGHPNVRSAALIAGGYVSQYIGLNKDDIKNMLIEEIKKSSYLNKDLEGYLKTMNQMFNKGLRAPIEYGKKNKN